MDCEPAWWKQLEDVSLNHPGDEDDNNLMQSWRGKSLGHNVPEHGWKIALSHKFKTKPTPWSFPPLTQIPSVLGLAVRYLQYYNQLRRKNKKPCMDFFNQNPLRPIYGVPLGGIGSGTINRGWQGDFCKWQLKPGIYTFDCPLADQFIVSIRRHNTVVCQQVLSTKGPSGEALRTWNWKYCGSYAYYNGLYPRAWTVYDLQGQNIVLTCRQISPVFPNDYKDTSLPAAVFVWDVENRGNEEVEVTIVMSLENGTGNPEQQKKVSGLWNEPFSNTDHNNKAKGVVMHNTTYRDMPYTLTVAAAEKPGVDVTHCTSFNPTHNGAEVWTSLLNTGRLQSKPGKSSLTATGEHTACAVAASCKVKPHSMSGSIDFALTWDMPQIHFGDAGKHYKRRYTRWFNGDNAGASIAAYALDNYKTWEDKIEAWQRPILDNKQLPDWYKSAIFNELYYITDGGTVWLEVAGEENGTANGKVPETSQKITKVDSYDFLKEYGKFAYLEGQEYKMYNTYDVHFYASIALAYLWPKLELSVQYDIATSILHSNPQPHKYLMDGVTAPVKTPNVVPHDVGCPDDEPWLRVNTYFVHDTADWRDLNPKFVLQAYRDYYITKDIDFLKAMWPICKIVMEQSMRHDKDNDGLIENSGAADQTFDGWCVTGPSAYCGGLWLAALRCMEEAADILHEKDDQVKFHDILGRATKAYQERLWNGKYFNYDCSSNPQHRTSVMADQCAGQWFLLASGICDVLPDDQVMSSLKTIFSLNVEQYDGGRHGAVNGMRPHGAVDTSSVQSDEVWTGVTYALAATMIHKGMLKEGFRTASGIYRSCWQRYGMAFQTPEAMRKNHTYRSLAYMRPLSIWGMQYALENPQE
ncbi:non-lysosomal glucosylceramidase [Ciona intestinalis]